MIDVTEHIGLVKATNNFDENKGFKFSTYAFPTISGEIKRFIGDDKKYNAVRGIPHNFTISSYEAEGEFGSLKEKVGIDSFEENLIEDIELKQAINKLTDKEKKILNLYYFDDMKQIEIAGLLNTSQIQISRIKKRIIKKLRMSLNINEKVSI